MKDKQELNAVASHILRKQMNGDIAGGIALLLEVQLDAMKEGARRAAEQLWEDGNPMSAKRRVLAAKDQWTVKDL